MCRGSARAGGHPLREERSLNSCHLGASGGWVGEGSGMNIYVISQMRKLQMEVQGD